MEEKIGNEITRDVGRNVPRVYDPPSLHAHWPTVLFFIPLLQISFLNLSDTQKKILLILTAGMNEKKRHYPC